MTRPYNYSFINSLITKLSPPMCAPCTYTYCFRYAIPGQVAMLLVKLGMLVGVIDGDCQVHGGQDGKDISLQGANADFKQSKGQGGDGRGHAAQVSKDRD